MPDLTTAPILAQAIADAGIFEDAQTTPVDGYGITKARFFVDLPDGTCFRVEVTRVGSRKHAGSLPIRLALPATIRYNCSISKGGPAPRPEEASK